MEESRRRILQKVKDGSLRPEDALRLLDRLDRLGGFRVPPEPPEPLDPPEAPEPPEPPSRPEGRRPAGAGEGERPRKLRIEHALGSVTVRGDPSVARFSVSGP